MSTIVEAIRRRHAALGPHLPERFLRLWAATEAQELGWGGISRVHEATGIAVDTIRRGIEELALEPLADGRQRSPGGGRKRAEDKDPTLVSDLEALVEPTTRGDPESPLRWTTKSTRKLAQALKDKGHQASDFLVRRLLHDRGYSLQSTRKRHEGKQHPDRDAQFQHINETVQRFQAHDQPVISIDAKKKELIGNFQQKGQEWQPKGQPVEVSAYDFRSLAEAKVTPYGVYDVTRNEGWVSVGIRADTAAFAVSSIERWWLEMGRTAYPEATDLLLTADCGGSNSYRTRLWKQELQGLADRTGLTLSVCHFPPGTSKWNTIEHRLFCHLSRQWRGRPLESIALLIELIGATTTEQGLTVQVALDNGEYPKGIKVTKTEMAALELLRDSFHGEWNYTIVPRL